MSRSLLSGLVFAVAVFAGPAVLAQTAPAYSVVDHIKAPDGGYDYASFDPVHRRLYVSRAGGVLAFDVDARTVNGHLADAQRAHEVLPLDRKSVVYRKIV
ncbi:MAG: hypothetical protein P4L64_15075, partial [Caulobacteraceae bacterium]|nr:hypothetical protein [Caulobacteraceae bacterium]